MTTYDYLGGGLTVRSEFATAMASVVDNANHYLEGSNISIQAHEFCSIAHIPGLSGTVDGQMLICGSYYNSLGYLPGQSGAGILVWKSTLAKSNHNGVTVFSPTVLWDGAQSTLSAYHAGTGETDSSGLGCWVRQSDELYARMAGAIGDGSADDTAALTRLSLVTDAPKLGEGIFKITGNIPLALGQRLKGDGQAYSQILVSGNGYDAISLSSDYASVEGVRFYAPARRTSGAYVALNSATFGNKVLDFEMQSPFEGISITANARITTISKGRIIGIKETTGSGIKIAGGGDTFLDHIVIDTNGSQPKAGINIKATNYADLAHIDIIHAGVPLLIDPGAGQVVSAVFADHVVCDTSDGAGIKISPTNGGAVRKSFFKDGWCATCDRGIHIETDSGAGSTVDSPQFDGYNIFNNKKQGYFADNTNGGISSPSIINSFVAGNSTESSGTYDGIELGNNINGISLKNNKSETHNLFGNSQRYGIKLGTGCNNYSILDNNVFNNLTGGILDESKATSTIRNVANNTGHTTDKRGTSTITAGNTSVTVTHGLAVTPDTASATPMADLAGTSFWVSDITSTNFKINITSAAGADKSFSWHARAY